ncbi:MAG: hypothetical protein NUV45_14015 [Tepidanaerobacteraceae bacterium]|jgi:hypothetical protein|nr:hypothetical protein [Tepidanaerobacteraceae bacterium]
MPRKARKKSESGIYHIIMRGINRQNIFEDDEDYINFSPAKPLLPKPDVENQVLVELLSGDINQHKQPVNADYEMQFIINTGRA